MPETSARRAARTAAASKKLEKNFAASIRLLPALVARHVTDAQEQRRIVRALVDRFNELLDRLARELHGWSYVDLRRTLADGDWGDEIHPKAKGFAVLAEKLRPVLQNLCPGNFRRRVELG